MRYALPILALACFTLCLCEEIRAASSEEQRPRVGLVLGGGGARGAAHIGVLQVLEELHIPVDYIAGTSMGSLVGAAYASGMDSKEITALVSRIDWGETFGRAGTRDLQPVHIKTGRTIYSNSLEFGWKQSGLLAPSGLVAAQQIETVLRSIVGRARYQDSFDDLPIPFRAIATEVRTGDMELFDRGDLAIAMRASMAVPGAFAAVQIDDRVLVDGGLVRNLPVDIARNMGADVIIASSLVDPQPLAENLQSMLAVFAQLIDVTIKNNERAQLATLGAQDVPILISLPDMTSADFEKVPSAIPLGARAAHAVASQLARYSVPPDEYARWRARVAAKSMDEPTTLVVNAVRVTGLDRVNPAVLERQIASRPGEPLTSEQVARDAQRIFSRGDFEKVDYSIQYDAGGPALEFRPLEKTLGPDYLRFDLGLMSNTGGDTGFILRAEHTRTWINALGAQWNNTLQVGRTALVQTSVFQPLDLAQRFFVEPQLSAYRELHDIFRGDESVARYELDALEGSLDAGMSLGTWGEFRVGVSRSLTDFTSDIGALVLPEVDDSDLGGLTSRFTVDTRDSPFLPTRGDFLRLDMYSSQSWLGAEEIYHRGELVAQHVLPFRRGMMHLLAAGGSDFGTNAPSYDLFAMRGARQLAGYQFDELRGREYALARIAYMYKVSDLQTLLGQALYAGISAEAGNMFERADGARAEGAIFGSSLMFGGRTPLGPLLIVVGFAEGGKNSVYLQIGRPLEEL